MSTHRCVTFKDQDGVMVNLVDQCIVCTWLHYIAHMVRTLRHCHTRSHTHTHTHSLSHTHTQRGRPMPDSNACQMVLKYMLMNRADFIKAYHDREYYYSSGTKFAECIGALQAWVDKLQEARASSDEEVSHM